jgi:predicted metal-binding membrane protein
MTGMAAMAPMVMPWTAADFVTTFTMWAIMMVGMMTPSVAPMILLYARVGRQARAAEKPFAATGWFAAGYFLSWIGFALAAAALEAALHGAALLTPMMKSASEVLGGAILIAGGLFQWSPLKSACLVQCQQPLQFIQRHGGFKSDASGSLRLGFRHGVYCVGCCWALMLLLFVGGVMNLLWIAGLAALIIVEKLLVRGALIPRLVGGVMIAGGVFLLGQNVM